MVLLGAFVQHHVPGLQVDGVYPAFAVLDLEGPRLVKCVADMKDAADDVGLGAVHMVHLAPRRARQSTGAFDIQDAKGLLSYYQS